ncbi:MAG: hypothetical protein WDW36_005452 [Sanguina aurantia]
MGCSASSHTLSTQKETETRSRVELIVTPPSSASSRDKQKLSVKIAEELLVASKGKRFHDHYVRPTLASYGASCKVLTAYSRSTQRKCAVKTIPKNGKDLAGQRAHVLTTTSSWSAVAGGELFEHISTTQGGFTERQAAQILRGLMLFLAHVHSRGIAHMDIKPENIMFDSEGADGILKVIDFGSSVYVQPNEAVREAFGTVRYSSPEMANDLCGQKTDIWSAGVVMYLLLCGQAPFLRKDDEDTLNMIKKKPKVKFTGSRWEGISQAAKDCIHSMLDPDPLRRPSSVQVLQMPWLLSQVPETFIQAEILHHLRTFANQSRIRRLLLGLMASNLSGGDANRLLGQFYCMDADYSGTIEVEELIESARKVLPDLTDEEVTRMFEALDVDATGTIDAKEFLAGLMQSMDSEKQSLVARRSFKELDKRGTGFVTKEIFVAALLERAGAHDPELQIGQDLAAELEAEFRALDANGDGVLSFEEFQSALGLAAQATAAGVHKAPSGSQHYTVSGERERDGITYQIDDPGASFGNVDSTPRSRLERRAGSRYPPGCAVADPGGSLVADRAVCHKAGGRDASASRGSAADARTGTGTGTGTGADGHAYRIIIRLVRAFAHADRDTAPRRSDG